MAVRLYEQTFDPERLLADYKPPIAAAACGARVDFTGYMRDFNDGRAVASMYLEHYPGMTEKMLERVCAQARQSWDVQDVLLAHRVGLLLPGDPIVLVAVWSAHRGDAFDACRFLISELKHSVPLWKREQTSAGDSWVARNTVDAGALPSGQKT